MVVKWQEAAPPSRRAGVLSVNRDAQANTHIGVKNVICMCALFAGHRRVAERGVKSIDGPLQQTPMGISRIPRYFFVVKAGNLPDSQAQFSVIA